MRDLMFAFVWLALLPVSLVSASMGVLIWVWTALLSPNELLYGFMAGVPLNKMVALTTIACVFLSREKKEPYADGMLILMLLLGATATISWYGSIVSTPDGTDLYEKLLKEVVLAFTIAAVMTTRHRIHLLVLVVALSFGFIAVKEGLIFLLTAGGHKVIGTGSVGDNNSLATTLLMVIPLMFYLSRYSAVRYVRIGLLAALGLSVVTVVATFSRGGFVGLLVLAAFMVKNSRSKVGSVLLVVVSGVLIYTLAPESWFERLNTIGDASNDGSFMGRVMAWKISWLIAMDHPLFGGGMHAVQRMLVWSTYEPYLYLLDFIKTPPPDGYPHAAHSSYFEVLGDLGFVGLSIFLTLLLAAFWTCRRTYRMARQHPSLLWAADLARMMQISLVVYVVTTMALSMAYFEMFYILLAMISRTHRTVRLAVAAEAAEQSRTVGKPMRVGLPQPAFSRSAAPAASLAGRG